MKLLKGKKGRGITQADFLHLGTEPKFCFVFNFKK